MEVFREIVPLREFLDKRRKEGNSIGFVATMGALHAGHLKLVENALQYTDYTVASIFINPTQFNNTEDLKHYPRTLDSDLEQLEEAGCHLAFCPATDEIYGNQSIIKLSFGYLEQAMEGQHRPGHFNGVGLVVAKLFNIIQPDHAFFGQKDLQQFVVIKTLTRELHFNIRLHCVETVRESDGLAMSSRNQRLSPTQRKEATILYKALQEARAMLQKGINPDKVISNIEQIFADNNDAKLEYFDIVNTHSLEPQRTLNRKADVSLCIAGYIGNVRLIDNIPLN